MFSNIFTPQIDSLPEFDDHQMVIFFQDKATKLRGFIAIHNTNRGPATGGTRFYPYASDLEAITDALNLSKAMSYKCALANVPFGGGKAVLIGEPGIKTKKYLRAYARIIDELKGAFTTGTDLGITDNDIEVLADVTHQVAAANVRGIDTYNTSEMAALGVFYGIQQSLKFKFQDDDLHGRTVIVKGLGKLGSELVRLLHGAGAVVIASDIEPRTEKEIKAKYYDVKIVDYRIIHKERADVFAPCALGNELTLKTVKELNSDIVCGGANNQLAAPNVGELLYKRGILYAPDYVVNAGGLINVVAEMEDGGYSKASVKRKVAHIKKTLNKIFVQAKAKNESTHRIADAMAQKIIYGKR